LIEAGALCFPAIGRFLSFDGRLLHAAPRDLAAPVGASNDGSAVRLTFLVNIWLQHKPTGKNHFSSQRCLH